MKAFWWFKREESIAGMARPGFNGAHWFDLPFDEAVFTGWIGLYGSGSASLEDLRRHVVDYGAKIARFYSMDPSTAARETAALSSDEGVKATLGRLTQRAELLEGFSIDGDRLNFALNRKRLRFEADFLSEQGIRTIVSLTEDHHGRVLSDRFETHHFPIPDLGAPEEEQVLQIAEIIRRSRERRQGIAVHCLAGIGRTSTVLIASHLALGDSLDDLKARIARQNPTFVLRGPQEALIHRLADRLSGT